MTNTELNRQAAEPWSHIPKSDDVRFAPNQKLPPGYRVVYLDSHTLWLAPDGVTEGAIHWNRWASYRGAWNHYHQELFEAEEKK